MAGKGKKKKNLSKRRARRLKRRQGVLNKDVKNLVKARIETMSDNLIVSIG